MNPFHQILANNLVANITNYTVWFAVTFWVYLETQSVLATGVIAGIYFGLTSALGFWLGSLVDHHPKKTVMAGSSVVSFGFYAAGFAALALEPEGRNWRVEDWTLWMFIVLVMLGVIAGNVRTIALPTLVTLMVPEDRRDKANGLVGMVQGIGFLTTSAVSGLLVAFGGMAWPLIFALVFSAVAFGHLLTVPVTEKPEPAEGEPAEPKRVDIAGTIKLVSAVPGLFALIFFSAFNNLLGGVFMALTDAYGLSMVKVQEWGLLWALISCAFILSGIVIARWGLGGKPLRMLLIANLAFWTAAALMAIQPSVILLTVGCFVWLFFGPYSEAAEHTTLQAVVPYERQGRVFGFAQSIELAASPVTALLIAPLTQFFFIPFMTDGAGADTIGWWFGTGPARGMALVFVLSGTIGVIITLLAWRSKTYRVLSAAYAESVKPAAT